MLKFFILSLSILVFAETTLAQSVPFKGREKGSNYVLSLDPVAGEMVVALEGTGNATQVGRYSISGEAVINLVTNAADISAILTAANGDQIFLNVDPVSEIINPFNVISRGTIEGGTGRFSNATGEWRFHFVYEKPFGELPNSYKGELQGTINKNKSRKKLSGNIDIPYEYKLDQNYPNPFNPTTNITYSLKNTGLVTLKVYDISGREVAILVDEFKPAGNYKIDFDASSLSSGTYLYRLQTGDPSVGSGQGFVKTKKFILLK